MAVQLAQAPAPAPAPSSPDERHVGYYLVDDGLARLQTALRAAGGAPRGLPLPPRRMPLPAYLLSIALVVAFFVGALVLEMRAPALSWAPLWLIVTLAIVVFSELGIPLVNWAATLLVAPRRFPRLDFSLLTDFKDADQQTLPGDEALLEHAVRQIDALNARHAAGHGDRFFLLHRPRRWNASEGCWMGHERKRGKLGALNDLLRYRDRGRAAFMRIAGNLDALVDVRYVITLDADTQLPRDAARELVATLAHPLNHARFDERRRRVTRGYGILQPVVGASMSGRQISRHARMYGRSEEHTSELQSPL